MRILCCGDRNWSNIDIIRSILMRHQEKETVIIEGEARGADSLARQVAEEMGLTVLKFPALWEVHGKAAGPIRNQMMLTEGKPDIVYAFHNNLEQSKGTRNMVLLATQAGIPVEVFSEGWI